MTRAAAPGSKILLAVTGGIAAYKSVHVARSLTQLGADVNVIMTRSATRFVGPPTFAGVTGRPAATELFDPGPDAPHVELARGADLAVVAPATAHSLAKLALGLADDLFTNVMLMVRCPILVAPAMHTEMWDHPTTREHVAALERRGVRRVGPASGPLMSGDVGPGRMAEPDEIVAAALEILGAAHDLAALRFVVTAGGTREAIDPVRFIGNRSSGLMGYEIAGAAARRGAKVTLVAGPTTLPAPPGVEVVPVTTAEEMRGAVVDRASDADVIVKAAAVADFRPVTSFDRKLKKSAGAPDVRLVPTPDILAELGAGPGLRKPGGTLVGFAAETEPDPRRLSDVAVAKRAAKGADLIVANDVSSPDSGFDVRTNRAVIAGPSGVADLGLVDKRRLAEALLDAIVEVRASAAP